MKTIVLLFQLAIVLSLNFSLTSIAILITHISYLPLRLQLTSPPKESAIPSKTKLRGNKQQKNKNYMTEKNIHED
ncbi:MAG: hypothetical protein ABIO46_07415 [Chitinophagales bacterium]